MSKGHLTNSISLGILGQFQVSGSENVYGINWSKICTYSCTWFWYPLLCCESFAVCCSRSTAKPI